MIRQFVLSTAAALAMAVAGPAARAQTPEVAIATIVEVPALLEVKEGLLAGLAERGYVEGESLEIDYQNANGNMPVQQQIASKFAGDRPDVIVAITTPTAQSMVSQNSDIPIVFTAVTDPVKAKLIESYESAGETVTGVSDAAPLPQQLELFREILPGLERLGFVYNPGLDNSLAALERIRELAGPMGIEIVESAAPTTNEVSLAARKLVGEVDAIYVPNDSTVVSVLETVIKVGQDTDTPVFLGETSGISRGAIGSVGMNYRALGEITAGMVADILEGTPVNEIKPVIGYEVLDDLIVVVNRKAAAEMGVELPESVLDRADRITE